MFRVLNCLQTQHDGRLVLLAGIVCFLTSLAVVSLFHRAQAAHGSVRVDWLAAIALVAGTGVWATHFIAMLAYGPGETIRYDIPLVAISFIVAILANLCGFSLALSSRRIWAELAGGAVIGIGTAAMHYIGMASIRLSMFIIWLPNMVVVSILLSIAFACAGIFVAKKAERPSITCAAAMLLMLGITSLHFVGMGAFELAAAPNAAYGKGGDLLSPILASLIVTVVVVALVVGGLVGTAFDRSYGMQLNHRLMQLDGALNNMTQGLCMFGHDGRLQLWNEAYVRMYRLEPGLDLVDASAGRLFELRTAAGTMFLERDNYATELKEMALCRISASRTDKLMDGRTIVTVHQPMRNGGWLTTHEDITERERIKATIEYLALHDPLTKLANRSAFNSYLEHLLQAARAKAECFALARIDIDRFRDVNDLFGQVEGDKVLRMIADRLRGLGEGYFVARHAGSEFSIVSPLCSNADIGEILSTGLLGALNRGQIRIGGGTSEISCTAGVSIFPQDGEDGETLMANANAALHRRNEELGTVRFFESTMDRHIREKHALQRDLLQALRDNRFELYFQPQATTNRDVVGFEALIRWFHPERGMVTPSVFIPLAEESDLISQVDDWVLQAACREAAQWVDPLSVSVNISPAEFRRRDVIAAIRSALLESGLDPRRLEIEITEGVLIDDPAKAFALLHEIKQLGVRVAMDDFGTGFSSLSYLQSFPFDKIKIDQSFVSRLGKNTHSEAIVRAVLGLSRALGIPVIAEGVETEEQLSFLEKEGCAEVQGYLIGRPQPIGRYREIVEGVPTCRPVAIAG